MESNTAPLLEMRGIKKDFFGNQVLTDINFTLKAGEVLGLAGENGAGKSTLMKILFGMDVIRETGGYGGDVLINGEKVTFNTPFDALEAGIGMVHQEFSLIPGFTATENILLNREPQKKNVISEVFGPRLNTLDYKKMKTKAAEAIDKMGVEIDQNMVISDMPVGHKQFTEIARELSKDQLKLLILDEPTAVLTPQETDKLFQIMRNMKADGKSLIIITHKLHEVLDVSDRVAVLRKGEYIGDVATKDADQQSLTDMMVGHSVSLNIDRPDPVNVTPRLVLDGLTVFDELGVKRLDNVSFTVNAGEVLGVAGVAGSGQRELLESIAGLYPIASGSVTYYDPADGKTKNLVGMDPMDIRKSGIAMSFVPEDRLGMGLVGSMGMTGNMMLRSWRKGHGVFLNRKDPEDLAQRIWQELEVVTPSTSFPVRRMSGGNVQKVLVGREIAQAPAVLMTAYAVRGLDINTSYTIYNLLTEQKMKGIAVMYVGEDLDVLLELCDRIVVLCGGQVSGVVDARTADKRQIGALMTRMEGGKTDE